MTDYDVHRPDYSGTTTEDWDAPRLEDFDTDDLSAVDDHFVLSSSGFPPEEFTDLGIPVVDPDGNLNENALRTAHGGAHSVEAMDDVDDDTVERVQELLEGLSRVRPRARGLIGVIVAGRRIRSADRVERRDLGARRYE